MTTTRQKNSRNDAVSRALKTCKILDFFNAQLKNCNNFRVINSKVFISSRGTESKSEKVEL